MDRPINIMMKILVGEKSVPSLDGRTLIKQNIRRKEEVDLNQLRKNAKRNQEMKIARHKEHQKRVTLGDQNLLKSKLESHLAMN